LKNSSLSGSTYYVCAPASSSSSVTEFTSHSSDKFHSTKATFTGANAAKAINITNQLK
jgi:hypothetical protein